MINSAVNMDVQISLQDSAYNPEVELLDHIVDLLLESASSSIEQAPGIGNGQEGLACCRPWGRRVGHD